MRTTRLLGIFFILSIIFFFIAFAVRAQVTTGDQSINIHVSNSGGESVIIENDVSASVETSSNTTSTTDIYIEQNGQTKEFHSTGEDIEYVSDDQSINVKVEASGEKDTQDTKTQEAPTVKGEKTQDTAEPEEISEKQESKTISTENILFGILSSTSLPFTNTIGIVNLLQIIF